jgi:hypothetical protein
VVPEFGGKSPVVIQQADEPHTAFDRRRRAGRLEPAVNILPIVGAWVPFDSAQGRPPPPVPPADVKPSTMEACWDAFCKENPGKTERDLYARWHEEIKRLTGKGQNDCTPEDWGVVLADFSKGLLPF